MEKDISAAQSNYFGNINNIVNYFLRTSRSALLFCVADSQSLIEEVNHVVIARLKEKEVIVVEMDVMKAGVDDFISQLQAIAASKPKGIIINKLDLLIEKTEGKVIQAINFARELLFELDTPLLLWLSNTNLQRFATEASDTYLRRDRGVIYFEGLKGISTYNKLDGFLTKEFRETHEYEDRKIQIELLEQQLNDALSKNYPKERIANEIVLKLIDNYNKFNLIHEAIRLIKEYDAFFDRSKAKTHQVLGDSYQFSNEINKALAEYEQALKQYDSGQDKYNMSNVYNSIGATHSLMGNFDDALRFHVRSLELLENLGIKNEWLSICYNNIGKTHQDLMQFDLALEYYNKALLTTEKFSYSIALNKVLFNIGSVYHILGDINTALKYYNDGLVNCQKTGDVFMEGAILSMKGILFEESGMNRKALECLKRSKEIFEVLGDSRKVKAVESKIENIKE